MKARYVLLASLLCLAFAFANPVYASDKITRGGFEFWLMDFTLDYDEEQRTYTPFGIAEFHMPIVFRKNTAGDLNFAKSDFSHYYRKLLSTSGMDSIRVQYLKNETYQEIDEWVCTEHGTKLDSFGRNFTTCEDGYYTYVDKWKGVWTNIPSSITIKSGRWYAIDIIGYKKAELGSWAVDLVPRFKGIELPEYAWWNASYSYKQRVNVSSTVGTDQTVIFNYTMDTQSLVSASKLDGNCHGLRVVNASEDGELNFDWEGYDSTTYGCNQTTSILWIQMNVLTANTSYFYLYYGDLASNALGNTTNTYDANYVAVMHLGEGTGNTRDAKGHVAGTVDGTWMAQIDDGDWAGVGGGVSFDGSSDEIGFGTNFDLTNDFTLELWFIKPQAVAGGTQEPMGQHDGGEDTYWILFGRNGDGGGNQLIMCRHGNEDEWSTTPIDNYGGWNHYACAYDSNNVYHYNNGTYESADAGTTDPIAGGASFYLAYDARWNTYWHGNITEARISDTNRSSDFIKLGYDLMRYADGLVSVGSEETAGSTWINWLNNASSLPANYDSGTSNFSIEWNSTDSNGYNVSLFGTNASGSWVNHSTTRSNNVSYFNITLPATTISWQWYANNSDNDWNASTIWTDTIAQATQTCTITNNESANEYYPVDVNVSGTCQYGSVILYRWDEDTGATTNVTNPNVWQPPSNSTRGYRLFNYTANTTGNANYSSATTQYNLTINSAPNVHQMYLDGNLNQNVNINVGTILNATVQGNGTVYIYMDGVQVNSSGAVSDIGTIAYYYNGSLASGEVYWFSSNATGNQNISNNVTGANYSVTVQTVLTVDVLDELTEAGITFNITLNNDTFSWTEYDLALFTANTTNMPYGNVTIIIWADGYPQRNYYEYNLLNSSNESIIGYLVPEGEGQQVSFTFKNIQEQTLTGVDIDVQRVLSGGWTLVAQGISDDTGSYPFFLDDNANYRINMFLSSYQVKNSTLIPSSTSYTIFLFRSIADIPSIFTYLGEVTVSCEYTNATLTLECNWTDTSGELNNVYLNVSEYNFTYDGSICTNTSNASSGTFQCILPASNTNWTYPYVFYGTFSGDDTPYILDVGDIFVSLVQVLPILTGVFASIMLVLTAGFLGFEHNPITGLTGMLFGIIGSFLIGVLTIETGVITGLVGFIVAIGVIIYKAEQR
jgi:hypothetical protein